MSLSVGLPWVLFALLLCPLVVLLAVRSRYDMSPRRRRLTTWIRAIAVALVVLAIADLRLGLPTEELAVATVVDRSASVSEEERSKLEADLTELRSENQSVQWVDASNALPDPYDSDIASDLELAIAGLPTDRVRRVVLATDGRVEAQPLRQALARARDDGVTVNLLAVGDDPPMDRVALRDVQVPRLVRAGETLDVEVTLHAADEARVDLTASFPNAEGSEEAEETVTTTAGSSRHRLEVTFPEEEGVYELAVVANAPGDVLAANDRYLTRVRVLTRPKIMILTPANREPPLLAAVLRDAQFHVDAVPIAQAPEQAGGLEEYGLVIVDEAKLQDLSEERQLALREWVEIRGGGLVTVTNNNAIRRGPPILREIEPVRPPPAIPEPRPLELVLVIDRSSSMDGRPIAQARAAAMAAVSALRQDALVGTVAFSGSADQVMAPVPQDRADEAAGFISRIAAGGGTNIAAALGSARAVMSNDDRYIHHVILLSDGESDPAPAIAQAHALAGSGVTISTITLGSRSPLMAQIAQIGRGRYHVTRSAGSLPAIFVREAQYRQPPAHRTVSFRPTVELEHRMVDDIDFESGPQLGGHVLTAAKPGADTLLDTPGNGGPLLTHWHVENGQVATFASATNGAWANEWREWSGFRKLWSQIAWAMLRTRTVDPLQLRVEENAAGQRIVTVLGPTIEALPEPVVVLHRAEARGTEADGSGERLELDRVGPGVWQSTVPLQEGFVVTGRMPAEPDPTAAIAADNPYPLELASFGADRNSLADFAAIGGGAVLESPQSALDEIEPRTVLRSLRTPLLAGALFFYLLGILLLRLPDRGVAASIGAGRKRSKKAPPPMPEETKEAA